MRNYKTFIAVYRCKKCGGIMQELRSAPLTLYDKPTDINDMYNFLDSRVPKTRISNCHCLSKGRTIQELIFITEEESQ